VNGLSTNRRCTKSAACLREEGHEFVVRYYSETTAQPEKALTPGEAQALRAAGLRVAVVYQDRARGPEDFSRSDGLRDGRFACQYAHLIGQPSSSTIFFAVDYDAAPADMARINAYFRGVRDALAAGVAGGAGYRVGVYGSGFVCRKLAEAGLVTHTWLAEATGWRESASYPDWNIKQSVTHQTLCNLPSDGWERCVSQGSDQSWSFQPAGAPEAPPDAAPDVNALPVLRRGAEENEVDRLQRLLNRWLAHEGALLLIEDRRFGPATYRAVRAFQASNVDNTGLPLEVDGIVGGLTWGALLRIAAAQPDPVPHPLLSVGGDPWWTAMPDEAFGGSARGRAALQVAVGEARAGAGEVGGDNMGPDVDKYLHDIVEPPNNWCAGFVCWCLENSGPMPFPYTVGARAILSLAGQAGLTTFKDPLATRPQPGDIAVWWRDSLASWRGHTGFVHHADQGRLFTIEGNKTSRVEGFDYPLVGMERLLGFVRI
jgi:hypothetical protein